MPTFFGMRTREDRALLDSLETGRGKRIAILVAALFAVLIVIWTLAVGFQGRHYRRSAGALTDTPTVPVR
jgi:hypothetical protein